MLSVAVALTADVFDSVWETLAALPHAEPDADDIGERCDEVVATYGDEYDLPAMVDLVVSWWVMDTGWRRVPPVVKPHRRGMAVDWWLWLDDVLHCPEWDSNASTASLTKPPSDGVPAGRASHPMRQKGAKPTPSTASLVVVVSPRQSRKHYAVLPDGESVYVKPSDVPAVLGDATALPPIPFQRF